MIEFSSNNTFDCLQLQVSQNQFRNSVDRVLFFELISMDAEPITFSVPNLTLIIEPDPPNINVPGIVSVSKGNTAVVCFITEFSVSGEATVALSTQGIATSSDSYNRSSIPSTITFSSSQTPRQCIRIPTFNNTNASKFATEAFSITLTAINSSSTIALPILSTNVTTVWLFLMCVRGDVRLVGGPDPSQGRVEICDNGVFATICNQLEWSTDEALTICAQLGFSGDASVPNSVATFGAGSGPFLPGAFSCLRSSTNFLTDCFTQNDFNSVCQPNTGVYCGCVENSIRLVGFQGPQEQPTEGRVEICRDNRWGSVCGIGWDNADAAVVCRQLNIQSDYEPSILLVSDRLFPAGSGPIFLSDVQCTGEELNISSCPAPCISLQECSHAQDAGVRCGGPPIFRGCKQDQFLCDAEELCIDQSRVCDGIPDCVDTSSFFVGDGRISYLTALDELNCDVCSDNEVRPLYGGSSPQEGVVEVCSNRTFHRIELSQITIDEAAVLCRHLKLGTTGFPFPAKDLLLEEGVALLLQSDVINTATLSCTGSEDVINNCTVGTLPFPPFFINDFAAIKCIEASDCQDGSMRLVPEFPSNDGSEPQEGRLEICYQGIWGAVYDNDWTGLDAAVTCQSFGFNPIAALPLSSVYYPSDPTILPVVYDVPQCTSLINSTLLDCPQSRRDGELGQTEPGRKRRSVLDLPGTFSLKSTNPTLNRVRRQGIIFPNFQPAGGLGLLLSGATGFEALTGLVGVQCGDAVPVGSTQIHNCFRSSKCDDFVKNTSSVENCCDSLNLEEPIGTFYRFNGGSQCMTCPTISPSENGRENTVPCSDGAVRLVFRGQSGRSGFLQICQNNVWSFFCSDSFTSSDARVACRQLGFEGLFQVVPRVSVAFSPIPPGVRPSNYRANFGCAGFEQNFSECSNFGQGTTCQTEIVVELECPALPRVILDPPSFGELYVIEQDRRADLFCEYNSQDYPLPNNITINEQFSRSLSLRFLNRRATLNDSGTYNCTVASIAGRTTKSVEIRVLGETGMVTSIGYLRLSYVNSLRQSRTTISSLIRRIDASTLANLVFDAIPPAIPGQQSVTCVDVTRSSFETERRLDRFECAVVTRGGSTDTMAGAIVAQTAATFLDVAFPGLYTNFQVSSIGFCGSDETVFNNVTLEWPETEVGGTISLPCPAALGQVTRSCGSDMVWNTPNVSLCILAINIINDVLSQTLTLDNYEELSRRVAVALMLARNDSSQQNDTLLELVSRFFDTVSALVETDSATAANITSIITRPVIRSLSASVAAVQQWPANVFVANGYSSSVIWSLESVISLYAQLLRVNETAVIIEENFVLVAENAPVAVLSQTGRTVSFENENFPSPIGSTRLADNQIASIALPPSLFGRITDRLQVGVFFALYSENTLFPVRGQASSTSTGGTGGSNTVVGTPVVASTVGPSLSFTNLEDPVQINLRLMSREDSIIRPGSETCVFWDFNAAGGDGNWSTEGCTTSITCDNVVRCNCTHLTNFAVLVDICSRVDPDGCGTSESFDTALSVITYLGVVLSMLGLILTAATFLIFKRLRNRDAAVFHVQFCIAMFMMLLIFISGIEQVSRVGGCMLVSILLHYFSLASFFWMTAEALLLFQKLVLVFRKVTKQSIIIISLVSWLVPLLFVIPPLIADLANGRDPMDDLIINRESFCFLSNQFVFGFTFLFPLLLSSIFNCIVLTVITVILVRHTKGSLTRKKEAMGTKTFVRLTIGISGIIFLFGISWLFAALTITEPAVRLPAQVLFTISSSFQGFFVFIFFCVLNEEARESWKEFLSCGKYKSSYLNPSLKWGKNSKAEHAERSKNGGTTFKNTSSTGLSSEKTDDKSNYYSDSNKTKQEKVDLSKAEEPTDCSVADPEYSTVEEPKKDLSNNSDNTPNVYAALVPPDEQEAEVHVYTKPNWQAAMAENTSSEAGNTTVELEATNKTFSTEPNTSTVVETAIYEIS